MSSSTIALPLLLIGCPGDGDDGSGGDGEVSAYCETCNLDHWVLALVTEGAVDCGLVRLHEDASEVARCVEEALASGRPFAARQQLQGIDSRVELAFVVDHDGVVQQLTYDSNICGSSTCDEACGPIVRVTECRSPTAGAMPEEALVDCDPGETATLCEPDMVTEPVE